MTKSSPKKERRQDGTSPDPPRPAETPPPAAPERLPRPSEMRILHLWRPPNMASSYRVDFFNTFARNEKTYKVCQRSIVVTSACCAEEARRIAQARFAELEGVPHWSIHAAEIEVVPLGGEEPARTGTDRDTGRAASPRPGGRDRHAGKPRSASKRP
jgi:hypothetical protein